MSYCVARLLNYILRAFFEKFSNLSGSGIFFVLRYLVPRSVVGPSAVSIASICCILCIFYTRGIFFDFPQFRNFAVVFPVFPLFVPLPRRGVSHRFEFRRGIHFLLFSMPHFIFLAYPAVKYLLPRKFSSLGGFIWRPSLASMVRLFPYICLTV